MTFTLYRQTAANCIKVHEIQFERNLEVLRQGGIGSKPKPRAICRTKYENSVSMLIEYRHIVIEYRLVQSLSKDLA